MVYVIILTIGILAVLLLGGKALGGPSPRKALKRRMELVKERHADGVLAANAQAQIRKLMAARDSRVESWLSTVVPKPALMRQRLEQTGKDISLARYVTASAGLALVIAALLMLAYLVPPAIKLKDAALIAVLGLGAIMMLIDLYQSLWERD